MNKPLFDQHRNSLPSWRRGNTAAFTLVEMLVVITIIGILVGLTIPAVMVVRVRAKNFAIKNDISQLEMACIAYKAKYGEFPPDGTDGAATTRHLRKVFPRYNGGLPAGLVLTPFNSLPFWLGGIWDNDNKRFIGFSANPANPFDVTSASRTTPFFEFDPNQVVAYDVSGNFSTNVRYWPKYSDGNRASNFGSMAYLRATDENYYSSGVADGADPDGGRIYPAQDSRQSITARVWINPKTLQIFTSGQDGKYGNPTDVINFPSGEDGTFNSKGYPEATYDDITNFSDGTLEDSMP